MTRRQLLTAATAALTAPALAALSSTPNVSLHFKKKLDVTAYESKNGENVLFIMTYSIRTTSESWQLLGRSFKGPYGWKYECGMAHTIPVVTMPEEVARHAETAMMSYCVAGRNTYNPEGEACFVWV